jgi:lysozyme
VEVAARGAQAVTDLHPLIERLKSEEGIKLCVYDDATGAYIRPGSRCVGNPTIGIGTNVGVGAGITETEAEYLLWNRLVLAGTDAATLPGWDGLDDVRRLVLVDMTYSMGVAGVRKFPAMLAAIVARDYDLAATEMLDSLWAKQVGHRATALADVMRAGVWA